MSLVIFISRMSTNGLGQDTAVNEYNKSSNSKNICHMKIIKSENFGDFIGSDRYHYPLGSRLKGGHAALDRIVGIRILSPQPVKYIC